MQETIIDKDTRLLVVSAHAGDFIWRSGGTIAKYIKHGAQVSLVILSYGARGESNDLWNDLNQTMENVKKIRRQEIEEATKQLGVTDYEIWDLQDYHMSVTDQDKERMLRKIREVQPHVILTHGPKDAFNPDHELVSNFVFEASVLSTSNGVRLEDTKRSKQSSIFGFEPHQAEISDFKPEVIIDITETYEQKVAAMNCFKAQKHLIDYYSAKALIRGNQARRCSGNNEYQYAEAFTRFFPYVGGTFN
ncbi:PIG-L deacetylase family protein [Desemzia sp. FAM 23989]|uniref:PIG-L deacetylase family protein n=1 Tax=Desemzia sp. FAM 23989 TaxID=3259523 RepID=UPI00388395A8